MNAFCKLLCPQHITLRNLSATYIWKYGVSNENHIPGIHLKKNQNPGEEGETYRVLEEIITN